jgi:hypothetical protein
LTKLKNLIIRERKKEISLITKMKIPVDTKNLGSQIKALNELLGIKDVFERNLELIKKHEGKSSAKKIDVSKYFSSYFYKVVKNRVGDNLVTLTPELLMDLIYEALEEMYKSHSSNKSDD